jgi:Domain of unknown function (DUF4292)
MNKSFIKISPILLLLFIALSCKPPKETTGSIKPMRTKELVKKVIENEVRFNTFSGKAKLKIIDEKSKTSFKGEIRIEKDKAIWMSITPLFGLEVARILITPDSIKILDRIHNEYLIKPFDYIQTTYNVPVQFSDLQSLLSGWLINRNHRRMDSEILKDQYVLTGKNEVMSTETFIIPDDYKIVEMNIMQLDAKNSLKAIFEEYKPLEDQMFSFSRYIHIDSEDDLDIYINFSRLKMNKELSFSFIIPSKYEEIH